jgi:hypothetical protein
MVEYTPVMLTGMWPFRKRSKAELVNASGGAQTLERNAIAWPAHDETGEIFDLDWLDSGTRKPLTDDEEAVIGRARVMRDPDAVLFAPGVAPHVRSEYNRRHKLSQFGIRFAHQPTHILRAGDVRGAFYLEWGDHIEHLKRTEHLETALALLYEVIDAAERVDAIEQRGSGAAGWYKRAAIILRKLGDYESEIRLIDDVERRFPGRQLISGRRERALALLDKQQGPGGR